MPASLSASRRYQITSTREGSLATSPERLRHCP